MERNWKKFKLDPDKVYKIIGQAVVYCTGYIAGATFCCWAFLQRNDLLGGKDGRKNI